MSDARVFRHRAMNTAFAVYFGEGDESVFAAAAQACFDCIDFIESLLSRFRDDSDVAAVRALKDGETAVVSPQFMSALLTSCRVAAATGGAFDPTVAPVVELVRLRNKADWRGTPPEELAAAFDATGMNRLVVDTEHLIVGVRPGPDGKFSPVSLDFGGVGKGLALDECAKILSGDRFELKNWLLDAGTSTVLASGCDPAGGPWRLGVGGEYRERAGIDKVELSSGALSGSGFEVQGAHVADPRRRRAAAAWAQVWTRAESAALADAFSTAALSLNAKELAAAADELGAGALAIREQPRWMDRMRSPAFRCNWS